MKWKRHGLIYCPDKKGSWMEQFAMLPTPIWKGNRLRIYLGFCDHRNVGRIGYIDVSPEDPGTILEISEKPVLDTGRAGCFDDNGVVPVSIMEREQGIYMYYIGFQSGVKVPYFMFCGLAVSTDGGDSFHRYSDSPILDRVNDEVYARCGVNVIFDEGMYKMWYIGSYKEGWTMGKEKLKPLYTMKYTESPDGILWNQGAVQCMEYKSPDEHGFGRPFVWKEAGRYKMMYSVRTYSRGYYIGYAESPDGKIWTRMDREAGIDLSSEGWDSENVSYPYLWTYEEKIYMFYNGNGCGKSGVGYAELIKD